MGKPGWGGGGGGGGGSGGKPGGGGNGKVGASTEGAATAPVPGVTTMGLGQSALVMGAEGISSSEISMSSPEDCCPCRESKEREVRVSPGGPAGSQIPLLNTRRSEKQLSTTQREQRGFRSSDPGPLPC